METDYKKEILYKEAKKKVGNIKGFYIHLLVYLVINVFLVVTGVQGENFWQDVTNIWNYSTAFFWGIGVFAHWASIFGVNLFLGPQWEERKTRELMNKDRGDQWE